MKSIAFWLSVVTWTARLLALGLFLLWGGFSWNISGVVSETSQGLPPSTVWLQMLAHLGFLMGLVALQMGTRREHVNHRRCLAFLGGLAITEKIAGHRYGSFLAFLAITIVPALLTLCCWFARAHLCQPRNPHCRAPENSPPTPERLAE